MAGEGAGKKLWGWYPTGNVWVPLKVNANGKVIVDMSAVNLNDLGDTNVPAPSDGYFLYWHDASSKWKDKAIILPSNILTTRGDIITRNATAPKRLALGTTGHYLTAGANEPAWTAPPSKITDADGDTSLGVEQSADEDKIHGKVKGVEAFLLDDAGVLTYAKQSAARAYKAAAQTIPNATWTLVDLDTTSFDIQEEFNTTTHRFITKKAGVYLIVGSMHWYNTQVVADKLYGVLIRKNGSSIIETLLTSSVIEFLATTCTDIVQLAVDDYLELNVFQRSGASKNVSGTEQYTHMSVSKIA